MSFVVFYIQASSDAPAGPVDDNLGPESFTAIPQPRSNPGITTTGSRYNSEYHDPTETLNLTDMAPPYPGTGSDTTYHDPPPSYDEVMDNSAKYRT